MQHAADRSAGRMALAVFAAAAVLRIGMVYDYVATDFYACPILDQLEYLDDARRIIAGHPIVTLWRAPVYVRFAALGLRVAAGEAVGILWLQALLSAGTAALVCLLGMRTVGRGWGAAAGMAYALYWPAILFCCQIVPVTLFVFLATLALWLLTFARRGATALAGAVGGVAALTRPTFLPILVVWALYLIVRERGLRSAAVFSLCVALVTVPYLVSGARQWGGMVPVSGLGGYNLFVGNNPSSDGKTVWASEQALYAAGVPEDLRPAEHNRRYLGLVARFVYRHPLREAVLLAKKSYYLINAHRISSTFDIRLVEENLPLRWRVLAAIPFGGVIFPLALVGLTGPFRDRQAAAPLVGFLVAYAVVVITFFVNERFRQPLVPAAVITAASGLRRVWAAAGIRRPWVALTAAGLLLAANFPGWGVADPRDTVELDIRHAWAFAARGRWDSCREAAERVRRIQPGHPRLRELDELLRRRQGAGRQPGKAQDQGRPTQV